MPDPDGREPAPGTPEDARTLARATLADSAASWTGAATAGSWTPIPGPPGDSRERIAQALNAQMIQTASEVTTMLSIASRASLLAADRRLHGGRCSQATCCSYGTRRVAAPGRPSATAGSSRRGLKSGRDAPPCTVALDSRMRTASSGLAPGSHLRKAYGTSSPSTASISRSAPASASACSAPTAPGKTTTVEICEGLTDARRRRGRGPRPPLGRRTIASCASGSASRSRRPSSPRSSRSRRRCGCSAASTGEGPLADE